MATKKASFWVTLACLVVTVLAGVGVIPAGWGVLSEFVLQNADKIDIPVDDFKTYDADVVRIVDGDTLEVLLLPEPGELEMLRLIGVDTPETVHPQMPVQFFGPEATQFVKNMCSGKTVKLYLQKDGPERGSYGRLLVYVELPGGAILNEEIIRHGFGYSYTKYPHEKTDDYNTIQAEAMQAKRGLWATVKFEDLPGWLRTSSPDVLK